MKILITFFLSFVVAYSSFADSKIIAVVDSDIITDGDLEQRYEMIVAQEQIDTTSHDVSAIKNHILNVLINEKIFAQEAKRIGITVTDKEIDQAIERIERSKSLAKGDFLRNVAAQSISKEKAIEQIKNAIVWEKMLLEIMAQKVEMSDSELFEFISNNHSDKVKIEAYLIKNNKKATVEDLKKLWQKTKSCRDVNDTKLDSGLGITLIKTSLDKVSDKEVKTAINNTNAGSKSEIFEEGDDSASFIVVCNKAYDISNDEIDSIRYNLKLKKAEAQAQYHMQSIKKKKFIKVYGSK